MSEQNLELLLNKVRKLNEIGIALSSEKNIEVILDKIVDNAKRLTTADGGTLYTAVDGMLKFEITSSDSLGFYLGGLSGKPIPFRPMPMYLDGKPNVSSIVGYVAHNKKTVNIQDAYHETGFDFSGPKRFDELTGYRTKSVIAVPIMSHEGDVIAVLQLINAYDPVTKKIIPFSAEDQSLAESLASEAGVALTNRRLINELKILFESFIKVIAKAIDEKSPMTANHGRRVPILCEMIAHALNEIDEGKYKDFRFTDEEIEELKVAAFLHDCGKITTPVHVVEKHSKLETIYDRLEMVQTRFEVLKRDAQIKSLEAKLDLYKKTGLQPSQEELSKIDNEYEKAKAELSTEVKLIEESNTGKPTTPEQTAKIKEIGARLWKFKEEVIPLLKADEIENLTIPYGNLTDKERKIIENHVVLTLKMLDELPFPKNLKNVPEIAGSHHERMDGKGYPRGLTKDQMSLPARILAVADVFEALSAPDRPYKKAMPLSLIHKILREKAQEGHLDPDIVEVFLKMKIGRKYGEKQLSPEQLDES